MKVCQIPLRSLWKPGGPLALGSYKLDNTTEYSIKVSVKLNNGSGPNQENVTVDRSFSDFETLAVFVMSRRGARTLPALTSKVSSRSMGIAPVQRRVEELNLFLQQLLDSAWEDTAVRSFLCVNRVALVTPQSVQKEAPMSSSARVRAASKDRDAGCTRSAKRSP